MKKEDFFYWLLSIKELDKKKLTHITEHFLKQKMFIDLCEKYDFFGKSKFVNHLEFLMNKKSEYIQDIGKYVWNFSDFTITFYKDSSEISIKGNITGFLTYIIEIENFSLMIEDITFHYSLTENEKDITLY